MSKTMNIRVKLADDASFTSEAEQNDLAQKIDQQTFTGPEFVGAVGDKRYGDVVVKVPFVSMDVDHIEEVGEVVAGYFNTSVTNIRIEN